MHPRDEVKAAVRRAFVRGPFLLDEVATVLVPEGRVRKAADPEEIKDLRVWEVSPSYSPIADSCAASA